MAYQFQSRFSYKSRAKTKKNTFLKNFGWVAAAIIFAGVFSFYCVLFPDKSGLWGKNIAQLLGWLAGPGRFVLPPLFIYLGVYILLKKGKALNLVKAALVAALFWTGLVFLSYLGTAVWKENMGGVLGLIGQKFFTRLFGEIGGWIAVFGLFLTGLLLWIGHTPVEAFHHLVNVLKDDWNDWKRAKVANVTTPKEKPAKAPPVVAPQAALSANPPPAAPPKISNPKIVESASSAPSKPRENTPKERPAKETPAQEPAGTAPAAQKKPYSSPSLEIFDNPLRSNPIPKEELTSRARLLEQTLANFNIAAAVVEIHPGPVITRYDLEPAPGVKVASITSRSADLALAMRSIGIRVIAPIPGKGAVGVEIPNSNPESVQLKDMLSRPEFQNHPSPLAFVMGKTVSGEPYICDLAAMPHMLIAGATGSGKSVAVHALISSILYRMPPDMVKFCMIDPKRLELPGYAQIPHLYDPRVPPIQAEVITNSKQASKALIRLVKVMEHRYDLFSKANVRNIDSYNKKRKEQGLPPEYYLVVIIDELADLMLTSPKEVEDSIQRLAQMARAVGIHLVLATQRPSVDVITGVIKANLPARIALRVASTTDSRVIIDTIGADVLLGKGDMLFLPPAQPDPVRIQGAYVSEKEVENLVQHVKQYGLPAYEDLFSSGSALEFAVEDKKEMLDLIEALKLVLERKRVSQDLLKAHFGSSARATNILSLLEVKEFIKKPEGSNRWEINFDMIEEFLSKVNNIPDEEVMA